MTKLEYLSILGRLAILVPLALACGDNSNCYGPSSAVEHVRQVKRMQPGAPGAVSGPKGPLEWGQVNFLHTTDSHGWLEGHLKEQNYGADWGDFASFAKYMKHKANQMGVDMLMIDTGDLHDGTGLSDSTNPDGDKSMPIFKEIDFDLLTIGNHELYVTEVALQMFTQYAHKWGDRYLTSNVKVYNQTSRQYEYVGATHRYFTTAMGLRVMAFGVLFDFNLNSNISQVIPAKDMIQKQWFIDALNTDKPIDMFILIGHNPVNISDPVSTMKTVWDGIRAQPKYRKTPIQVFGGHTHIRDFAVYDESSIAIESGCYCETLGWVSMSGFNSSTSGFRGPRNPVGVLNPSRKALNSSTSPFVYSRRYLDWNRKTFVYHSTNDSATFDDPYGLHITGDITTTRAGLKLGDVYGCAPETWCINCVPFGEKGDIYTGVVAPAIASVVVNQSRADKSRLYLGNTGIVRFDLHKGPFTYDDNFIVAPIRDVFMYIADVPFSLAREAIDRLNTPPRKRDDLAYMPLPRAECINPALDVAPDSHQNHHQVRSVMRRQELVPGHVTKDAWGTDGDDTLHTSIAGYKLPRYFEAQAGFPQTGNPDKVDLVFFDFLEKRILPQLGANYTHEMVHCYINCNFTTQDFMLPYAKKVWQANINNCPLEK
ncbi:Secreted protein [Cladobotryum mycophilum]|uniref:Secreted protein n=1 Tax=Cladobotryum mycophilum TaxID=491253 RepID=A0ABR0SJ03_9HYPO